MKGGVVLFRGVGAGARRYLESDRSLADEYYLEGGIALASFVAVDGHGVTVDERTLSPEAYAAWVDWVSPSSGESTGVPRQAGAGRSGSPRFAEMVVNAPKSLSIAAALHPDVSDALDAALADAATEIRSWLGRHSVTRVGPRGRQEVVPAERLEAVAVMHKTSRAGDPHRHIHLQIGTRVKAAGAWRGLDTAALFRQQGAIRALGTAVIAAHPQLARVLDAHGLTLNPTTGEVAELQRFNQVMSKRAEQVTGNLARFEAAWRQQHPGREPGPAARSRLVSMAWDHDRPHKKPARLGHEAAWQKELADAGYRSGGPREAAPAAATVGNVAVRQVASRALDRCAAAASTWTVHDIQQHVTHILTEIGVRSEPRALRRVIAEATSLAASDCLSVLPPGAARPEHVAHLTSVDVIAAETRLRDMLLARAAADGQETPNMSGLARVHGLDVEQERAAAAVAGTASLVVVEGAAGSGKTTMLGAAISAAAAQGRRVRIVTTTKKAADVATQELGTPANSVANLLYEHGWRWDRDGVWTRLAAGDTDPATGIHYTEPSSAARLSRGERIVVDEAGMLDQASALALLTIADEYGATLALVGDRAQLPAVGRGGVLDIAAALAPRTFDMTSVHRFSDPAYARLTVQMRRGEHPAALFDRLHARGLVVIHADAKTQADVIAAVARERDAITVATNEEARDLNRRIRSRRVTEGSVDDERTVPGSDGLEVGRGDVIQTRRNDAALGVANRQTWTVRAIDRDGTVWAVEQATGLRSRRTVHLPAAYVGEHAHLAYATTAYGSQGVTVDRSHTVLSDAMAASGVYVGMTRGRGDNMLHIVAADIDDARQQFVLALDRDRADRGLDAAGRDAGAAVTGLVADGPARTVREARAALAEEIAHAEREAERLETAVASLTRLREAHHQETEQVHRTVDAAEASAERVRAEAIAPLLTRATAHGAACVDVQVRMWETHRTLASAGRFRRRAVGRLASDAAREHRALEDAVRRRWGTVPASAGDVASWAQAVAERAAGADPRVIEAGASARQARAEQDRHADRHYRDYTDLHQQLLGGATVRSTSRRATELRTHAQQARNDLAEIDRLPLTEAARLVQERQYRATAEAGAQARRVARDLRSPTLAQQRQAAGRQQGSPRREPLSR